MTLRTRILLGYGYLIALLLLSVSVAAINSSRVAGNARQIRERNIDSLTVAVQMLEQIERQDSETLLGLLHPAQGTRLEEAEKTFQSALASAMALDEAGGGADSATLARISEVFTHYRKVRSDLLSTQHEDALASAEDYGGATNRAVIELKQLVLAYLEGKKDALKTANEEASRTAVEGAVLLGVMVTLALLSLGFLSRSLQRDVLGRLLEVGHVTEAIAAGDRRRRVRDFYHDELGLVARQLNAALDRQHELESQMQGRLLEQRRGLVGLLNQWPTPAAMIGIDGEVVASTLTADDEAELDRLTPRIRAAAKVLMTRRFVKAEELAVDIKASDGDRLVRVRAMASGDNQISGWLATFVGEKKAGDEPKARFEPPAPPEPDSPSRPSDGVTAAPREATEPRPVAHHGSASLAPTNYEPSGMRSFGSASLAPPVREQSGLMAPPREASGLLRPVTLLPGGAHEGLSLIGAEEVAERPRAEELRRDAGEVVRDAGEAVRDAGESARDGEVVRDAGEGARESGEQPGAGAREDVSADMAALRRLAFPPPPRLGGHEAPPPVTRTPDPPPDTKS